MKNTLAGLLLAGLLAAVVPPARAEVAVGLEGGYFIPSDKTMREFFKEGPTEGLSFHLRTWQGFGLLFLADYYTQTKDFAGETFRVTSYPVTLQALYYLAESPRLSPFLAVGVSGLWASEEDVTTGKKQGLSAKVGLSGSAGVEFGPRSWRVRPFFRWGYIQIPGQEAVQGLNLSGYTIVAGANVNFGQPKKPPKPAP
jgi:opacity protein-like surface antigen